MIYAFAGMQSTAQLLGMEQRQLEFWVLGFVIALVLGGSQALSRSLFAQMIPQDQEAEFYSFYEISERGTSWMGTFVFGLVNQMFGSLRLGILSRHRLLPDRPGAAAAGQRAPRHSAEPAEARTHPRPPPCRAEGCGDIGKIGFLFLYLRIDEVDA